MDRATDSPPVPPGLFSNPMGNGRRILPEHGEVLFGFTPCPGTKGGALHDRFQLTFSCGCFFEQYRDGTILSREPCVEHVTAIQALSVFD